MSYQVLARKWRPQTFDEVVGQGHIITALSNGLKEQRLHHAYLFSGTRGVGKTSIARLFAKGLNCIKNGITDHPCGECENCKAIEQGSFIDLIEIDAASRTKVEDTRELLDNVQYKPVVGRFKVYLIDEVHMLSRHSFNALLKTLEEPPEYVKFLLATTDPQKLPVTILSRCMQFHLKALNEQQISQHLAHILTQENIPFEPLALDKLAKAAQGGIRDSLSLTDQAIAMGDRHVTVNVVNAMLGLLDDTQAIDIIYALHQGNGERLMRVLQTVSEKAGDWDQLLAEVAEKLHQIALIQLLPQNTANENEHLTFLAEYISPEDVQFFYQVIVSGRKELSAAPNYRVGVEMTLLRALAFHPKFLAATPKANLSAEAALSVGKGAAENSGNYIDMPVLSQNIKSNYKKTKSVQPTSSKHKETNFVGLAALEALKQLDQIETSERQARQKEMDEAVNKAIHQVQTLDEQKIQRKMTALPVREMTPPKKVVQSGSKNVSEIPKNVQTMMNIVEDHSDLEQEEREIIEAENYRWEWSNPELAKETLTIAPSDIKQAILKDITPELNSRIIEMTQTQDEWANIVESSGMSGFSKELALNCFLLDKTEEKIYLGLHSTKAHLRQERSIHLLAEALSQFYEKLITIDIQLDDRDSATPMVYRKKIYQDLREQARDELQQDKKLLLLQKEFDAKLDIESIRPV
ncbi:DNA polymerase III subunit gamma/tau [Rodentibacter caecimuris]|uniref:DNA polymerase III subunit gamma/tau n=1 Tax=Rodentibacter caecimuris TaxID=1796644 RepID=UPI001094C751|nr:DNA polymerase III subunit gamma/tau [Pasteurella caecimuris]MCR1836375.1 DNA polymerase III subunit gamma/tau [Pasteurella caecimuris]MCU0105874.1 DNA polymerase III subunit gamma/tau [Pasteurella caecimuris]TGY50404.1 DNA polymerase III subunit gamma/tau [Pasteurella caecimuris]